MALTWTLALGACPPVLRCAAPSLMRAAEDEYMNQLAEGQTFPQDHPAVAKAIEYYLRAIFAPPKYGTPACEAPVC